MKKLYVIRHAKSSWADPTLSDFDRPLKKRGKNDAPLIGKILNEEEEKPDLILSSPAKRALSTAIKILKELNIEKEKIVVNEQLYCSDIYEIQQILTEIEKEIDVVYLIGHNPELLDFVYYLCDSELEKLSTCGVVKINLDIESWNKIKGNCGKIERYITPKMFK